MPYHRRLFQPLRSRRAVYYTHRYALVLARTGHRFLVHTARDERHDRVRRLASAHERATRPNPITQTLDDDEEEKERPAYNGRRVLSFTLQQRVCAPAEYFVSASSRFYPPLYGLCRPSRFSFWVGLLTTGSLIERDTSKLRETTAVDEVCVGVSRKPATHKSA
jgi:hypothetical protein